MKLGITTLGVTLAGLALFAPATWAQDASNGATGANKPKPAATKAQNNPQNAQNKPKPQPQANKPQNQANKPAPTAEAPAPAAEGEGQGPQGQDAIIQARYKKASTPGDQHTWLAGFAGKWKMVSRHTIVPDKAPLEAQGTSEFKMLMDGRFLVESQKGNSGAGPYEGMGVIGFNTFTGKFERVWFDTTSTAMVKSEGEFFGDGSEVRWTDTITDPLAGDVHTVQSRLKKVSDTEFTFTQTNEFRGTSFIMLAVQYKKG